jgi:phage tail-like protein
MAVVRDDPYPGQNFLVDLGDGSTDGPHAGFQEVTGLENALDVTEYRTGNDRDSTPGKILGLNKVAYVTLRRGICGSLNLYKWFDTVRVGKPSVRNVTITLLNEVREPVLVWKLIRARPVKLSYDGLNARGSEIAMEELVLAYERLEME